MNNTLSSRIVTSLVILPLLIGIMWFGGIPLTLLGVFVFGVANYEFFSLQPSLSMRRRCYFMATNALIPLGYLCYGVGGFAAGCITAALLFLGINVVLIESETHEIDFEHIVPWSALGFLYAGVVGSLFVLVTRLDDANVLMGWLLCVVVFSDTLSFFGGVLLRGPKLAPRISPNKTISGGVCGLIGAIAASVLAGEFLEMPHSAYLLVCYGILAGLLCQIGDLAESLIKRVYKVKDIGSWLPGHGGLLDRVDAYLFACAVLFFL